jgi:hypothetical protein
MALWIDSYRFGVKKHIVPAGSDDMTTHTGRDTRTISGYVTRLLEYPRSVIECDVDFTSCRYEGRFNPFIGECIHCHYGGACRWLNQYRTPSIKDAELDELVAALHAAVDYLAHSASHDREDYFERRSWIKEARGLLRGTSSKHQDRA